MVSGKTKVRWACFCGAALLFLWGGRAAVTAPASRGRITARVGAGGPGLLTHRPRPGLTAAPVGARRSRGAQELAAEAGPPLLVVQSGYQFPGVVSMAFSPDGKLLAGADYLGPVRLWDVATGDELRSFIGLSMDAKCVAFSPDGKVLAGGGSDQTVKLWNAATGALLHTLTGHTGAVEAVSFSPDRKTLATLEWGKPAEVSLWDVASGKPLRTFPVHSGWGDSVAFDPSGRLLAYGLQGGTARLWDVTTGKTLRTFTDPSGLVDFAALSPDGRLLATVSRGGTVRVWVIATGREFRTLVADHDSNGGNWVVFSPDGKILARTLSVKSQEFLQLWDVRTGRELGTLEGRFGGIFYPFAFRPDGGMLASVGLGPADYTSTGPTVVHLWDLASGKVARTLAGRTSSVSNSMAISSDGRVLATGCVDITARLWDLAAGKEIRTLTGFSGWVESLALSPDGKRLASGDTFGTVKLWDVTTGQELHTLTHPGQGHTSVSFSPDGRVVACACGVLPVELWDAATGKVLRTLLTDPFRVVPAMTLSQPSIVFSPGGKLLACIVEPRPVKGAAPAGSQVQIWDLATGHQIHTLGDRTGTVFAMVFSPNDRLLAVESGRRSRGARTLTLYDLATGNVLHVLPGEGLPLGFSPDGRSLVIFSGREVSYWDAATGTRSRTRDGLSASGLFPLWVLSPDGRTLLASSSDGSVQLWSLNGPAARELCRLYSFDEGTWAVVDPQGRYDASNGGGVDGLHWVVGIEPIDLRQFKDGYYEPGLLAKLLGFNKEKLRPVPSLADVKLYPEVSLEPVPPGSSKLTIHLKNRGGGIGPVQVFVNGKEFLADARGPRPRPTAPAASLTVELAAPTLIPGQENRVRVVARNARGELASRGVELAWVPQGAPGGRVPQLYAIVAGISAYGNPAKVPTLAFPAKDALEMARAVQLGACRLFGPERVHLTLLTGEGSATGLAPADGLPAALPATKENFRRAFAAVRQASRPEDILVVYLAGHGVTLGQGSSTYCYLTQDAGSTELAGSPFLNEWAVTSEELAEWTKVIPARHQVLILDTCAAGAAAAALTENRAVPGDQIRAIERLKDRVGFHVLMGCAADAVSYEASRYGQGLLTYALLQGMRGPALRNEEFVDVSRLFQYAADEVPELAGIIGGIQRPEIAAPTGTSFDVGELDAQDRAAIPLAQPRPQILRPVLLNAAAGFDDLDLMPRLRRALRDMSLTARGPEPPALFVDAEALPGAVQPSGTYTILGQTVTIRVVLRRDQAVLGPPLVLEGTRDDLAGLVTKLAGAITTAAGQR